MLRLVPSDTENLGKHHLDCSLHTEWVELWSPLNSAPVSLRLVSQELVIEGNLTPTPVLESDLSRLREGLLNTCEPPIGAPIPGTLGLFLLCRAARKGGLDPTSLLANIGVVVPTYLTRQWMSWHSLQRLAFTYEKESMDV